jgi:hypothetical protein
MNLFPFLVFGNGPNMSKHTLSKQHFYWPSMKDYVTKYCNSCDSCAARKPSRSRNKAPLGKYVVGAPLERVCLDIFWTENFPLDQNVSALVCRSDK